MSRNANATLSTMGEAGFGSFVHHCRDVPSVPWCNLFYKQLSSKSFELFPSDSSPVGVNPSCGIPRAGNGSAAGNIANMIACAVSAGFTFYLIQRANRRKAAVGRIELRATLAIYILACLFQLVTTGSFLEQGSLPLVILTAVHAGLVASLFWCLVGNAVIATQVVEDGTPASLIPFHGFSIIFFVATAYISLDTAMGFTTVFQSAPPRDLKNIALFILLQIWPAVAALIFFGIMTYVVVAVLREMKPLFFYCGSLAAFIAAQVVFFLANKPLCEASSSMVDGSFIATILQTASLGLMFAGWMTITEGSWDTTYFSA